MSGQVIPCIAVLPLLSIAERVGRRALWSRGVKSCFVETRAGWVHAYDAEGDGPHPCLVLLHGIGSSATAFAPVIPRFRHLTWRVIAPELPGHGFSDSPSGRLNPDLLYGSMAEALDKLVAGSFILFGNSLGGGIAIRYALENPRRVRALILVSPAGARMEHAEWDDLVRLFMVETVDQAKDLLRRIYFRPPWFVSLIASEFRARARRPAVRDFFVAVTPDDTLPPEQLAALSMPVLLLWGQGEKVLPASNFSYFQKYLPAQTRFERPPGFGHCPHIDNPRGLASAVSEFLNQLPTPEIASTKSLD